MLFTNTVLSTQVLSSHWPCSVSWPWWWAVNTRPMNMGFILDTHVDGPELWATLFGADKTANVHGWCELAPVSIARQYVKCVPTLKANKYVRLRGQPYIHTCRSSIADRRQSPPVTASAPSVERTGVYRQYLPRAPIRPILGFWGSKVHKMGDSLPWTPMNHRAKFDAASFILAG